MKNVSYAAKGRAGKDVSGAQTFGDEKDAEDLDKPSSPNLKNPGQKYQIVDSSDEELEQDTNESVNLSGRRLQSIPESAIGQATSVKILTLTNNQIRRWDNLAAFTKLETLILDKNNLKTLKGLPSIKTLKTLWLNNNNIDDLELILQQIKSLFPNVEYLSVLRNPINPAIYFGTENEKPYYRFRRQILKELPNLKVIDTQNVADKERGNSRRKPKCSVSGRSHDEEEEVDQKNEHARGRKQSYYNEKIAPAAFIGQGKMKYDGRDSEGNRFITNMDL